MLQSAATERNTNLSSTTHQMSPRWKLHQQHTRVMRLRGCSITNLQCSIWSPPGNESKAQTSCPRWPGLQPRAECHFGVSVVRACRQSVNCPGLQPPGSTALGIIWAGAASDAETHEGCWGGTGVVVGDCQNVRASSAGRTARTLRSSIGHGIRDISERDSQTVCCGWWFRKSHTWPRRAKRLHPLRNFPVGSRRQNQRHRRGEGLHPSGEQAG